MQTLKKIQEFKNALDEPCFWAVNDTPEYFDTSKVKSIRFLNLKKIIKQGAKDGSTHNV